MSTPEQAALVAGWRGVRGRFGTSLDGGGMETATTHISRRCRPFIASAVIVSALLLSIAARTPAASGTASVGAQFTQTRAVAHSRSVRPAYGWPVKPFDRQHPVRAYLNDPRNGHGDAKSFHFGIDVTAPNGTAVYAVEAGEVFLTRGRMAVAVKCATRIFGYWHVVPAVRTTSPFASTNCSDTSSTRAAATTCISPSVIAAAAAT